MKICQDHWAMCRKAIDDRGLTPLVAKSGEAAHAAMVAELQGEKPDFDPLMSLNWHFSNHALEAAGLWILAQDSTGRNDGHFCPLCVYVEKQPGFVAEEAVGSVADQIAAYCREQGLIPKVS